MANECDKDSGQFKMYVGKMAVVENYRRQL